MIIPDQLIPLFEPELLREMEAKASYKSYKQGDVIIDYGQNIRFIPIILSGLIKVLRTDEDREILLYYLNPLDGCAITFTCCMQLTVSEIRAIAEEDVEMLVLPVNEMDVWMMKYPSWKRFVMTTLQNRFNELLKTIDQIAFQHLDERLVQYLKENSKRTGSTLINLSHEEIARDLASSRVVISRLLKTLENSGKLLLYRNQIKLLREL